MKLKEALKYQKKDTEISIINSRHIIELVTKDFLGFSFKNIFDGTYEEIKRYGKQLLECEFNYFDKDENGKFYITMVQPGLFVEVDDEKYKLLQKCIDKVNCNGSPEAWQVLDENLPSNIASHYEYSRLYFTHSKCYGLQAIIKRRK